MKDLEAQKIAQVVYNKMCNDNIWKYEHCALLGENYQDKLLNSFAISVLDVERAIEYGEDLNEINDLKLADYLTINLNSFLTRVLYIREYGIDNFVALIEKGDINLFPDWLPNILECFTYEEGLILKKAFLKRIYGFIDIDFISNYHMDERFFEELDKLRVENEAIAKK